MSPVSETTVVMARNCSSLLVMGEPPSGRFRVRLSRPRASYASRGRWTKRRAIFGGSILGGCRCSKPSRFRPGQDRGRSDRNLISPSLFLDMSQRQERAMPNRKNLEELFSETLKDIYFAEKQILRALPKMAKEAAITRTQAGLRNPSRADGRSRRAPERGVRATRPAGARQDVRCDPRHHRRSQGDHGGIQGRARRSTPASRHPPRRSSTTKSPGTARSRPGPSNSVLTRPRSFSTKPCRKRSRPTSF